MRKCHAITLSGNRCDRSIKSGCTITRHGHSHYLCQQHYEKKDDVVIDLATCPPPPKVVQTRMSW
jgi:hypothetical protein